VIRWAVHRLGVEEWLVLAVTSMYTGEKTVLRTVYSNFNSFEVKVGMHQGSASSPLLFVIVMEALSIGFRIALDWIEQGLTSHQTHYRSYRGRVFIGQMTQPTVSMH